MTTSFPTGLDAFTNPGATDYEDGTGVYHDEQHANANDAVEALEAKVGIDGSAVPSTLDYQMENHTHTGGVLSPDVLELPADYGGVRRDMESPEEDAGLGEIRHIVGPRRLYHFKDRVHGYKIRVYYVVYKELLFPEE